MKEICQSKRMERIVIKYATCIGKIIRREKKKEDFVGKKRKKRKEKKKKKKNMKIFTYKWHWTNNSLNTIIYGIAL